MGLVDERAALIATLGIVDNAKYSLAQLQSLVMTSGVNKNTNSMFNEAGQFGPGPAPLSLNIATLPTADGNPPISAIAASANFAPKSAGWVTATAYIVGQLVSSSGSLYRTTTAHTSGASFDASKFTAISGRSVGVLVTDFGAVGDGATDDTAAFVAAVTSGSFSVSVPSNANGYYLNGLVTVPAGVTVTSTATITLGASGAIVLGGAKAKWLGGAIVANTYNPSRPFSIRMGRDDNLISGVVFTGTARTSAVGISYEDDVTTVGTMNGGAISGCSFLGTAYGVLKNGNATTVNQFKVKNNVFRSIVGGDAIEWNLGASKGLRITGNSIDGVARGSIANAGIAIGIAGNTYTDLSAGQCSQEFVVSDNSIRNVGEGVHVEACSRFLITDNVIQGAAATSGNELIGAGVVVYGSSSFTIRDNQIMDSVFGVITNPGGAYPNRDFVIDNNYATDCQIGFYAQTQGSDYLAVASGNVAVRCGVPYQLTGIGNFYFSSNKSYLSLGPSIFDFSIINQINGGIRGYANGIVCENNILLDDGGASSAINVTNLGNLDGLIVDSGNTFTLGALPGKANARLFYDSSVPLAVERNVGDVTINTGTSGPFGWACTAKGSQQKAAGPYTFTATAGNNYVVINSPGDPSVAFSYGQIVSVPGIGISGATVIATIRRLYINSSQYRVELSKTVITTVTVSSVLSVANVSSHRSIGAEKYVTASRPSASTAGSGFTYYDTTLSKPVWSDGTVYRDSTGVVS